MGQATKYSGHYDTPQIEETEFEPGSGGAVLKNLLGITDQEEMDRVEAEEQLRALEEFISVYDRRHRFRAGDVCHMHEIWLGGIYGWAGKYRNINLTKGGFTFAVQKHIPRLMEEFEKGPLQDFTPCNFPMKKEIAKAIAVVHTELVLIHPFREGNGRLARLLAILMALQAGLPPLDFGGIKGGMRKEYFKAVQDGMGRDYRAMERILSGVIDRSLQARG